jgi:AcrR family transcriptional regulator
MSTAPKSAARRDQLTARIAVILLEEAAAALPLRDLAARLKTSDRMLLYYFGTQAALTRAALGQLSEALAARLEAALPPERLAAGPLLKKLLMVMAQPDIAPILKVWADVAARGARGEQPFAQFAQASVTAWLSWTADRLDVPGRARREKTAAALLVVIEGSRMLELSAPGAADGAAALLTRAFD